MSYAKFFEVAPAAIKPLGLLRDILQRQEQGLSGNFEVQKYPFNTKMWVGGVTGADGHVDAWWPYEQGSYLLDGLERLGTILDNKKMLNLVAENIKYLTSHPAGDGRLGGDFYPSKSLWPFAVIFRAFIVYYETTHDQEALQAWAAHFKSLKLDELNYDLRDVTSIEGLAKMAEWTGDRSFIKIAQEMYRKHNEHNAGVDTTTEELPFDRLAAGGRIVGHGVTVCEELKLPVILYIATGNQKYLDGALTALERILADHEQASGMVSANEFLIGSDPVQGYEMCVITDFTWCLGYFLQATGRADFADRIEKIIYNALPGAIYKDFSLLQYFSAVNQFIATPYSHNEPGMQEKSQYRPNHFPECCGGNLHRAMPNFLLRSWMLDKDGAPVATLYGGSELTGQYEGSSFKITETTDYPFDDKLTFKIRLAKGKMPLTLRLPAWCSRPEIRVNGVKSRKKLLPGSFVTLPDLTDGTEVTLIVPMDLSLSCDRQFNWFEYGPLLLAHPLKAKVTNEQGGKDIKRFEPVNLYPKEAWNYAVCTNDESLKKITIKKTPLNGYPYDNPPLVVSVPVRKITGYDSLQREQCTPFMPLFYQVTGPAEQIDLVPFGATLLRIGAFPDAVERTKLQRRGNQLFCAPERPFDFRRPLAEQKSEFEYLTPAEFERRSRCFFPDFDREVLDLRRSYCKNGWLYVDVQMTYRVDKAMTATLCVGASLAAVGYLNGKMVCDLPLYFNYDKMAPNWFPVKLQKGDNVFRFKVAYGPRPAQYRDNWGLSVQLFK